MLLSSKLKNITKNHKESAENSTSRFKRYNLRFKPYGVNMNNNNNINFDDDNWLFTVSGALSIEKKLWGNIEVVEDYLRVDFISIYHIDTINQLSLNCWLPVNRETDHENLLEFCNLHHATVFPKIDIDLDELFDEDGDVYYEQDIRLFLRVPTHGGISVPALQETVKLFWEDTVTVKSKLIDKGWLKE